MKRIRILKVYFIFWLFIGYIIYSNWGDFVTFYAATVAFNTAVLAILLIGAIFLLNAGVKLVMIGGTFGALAYKRSGFDFYLRSIDKIMPPHIAHMFYGRKTVDKMLFTEQEAREVTNWLIEKFDSQKGYINFFISTPLLIGLFGTFTGLLKAIDDMGKIVISLTGDIVLNEVIASFSGPLSGMAIGFGSSLFAVAVAITLGVKSYILYKYEDILLEGIEDWLKERVIDVSIDDIDSGASGGLLPEKKESFLDLFIEQMNVLSKEIGKVTEANKTFASMSVSLDNISNISQSQKESMDELAGKILSSFSEMGSSLASLQTESLRAQGSYFGSLNLNIEKLHEALTNEASLLDSVRAASKAIEDKIIQSSEVLRELVRVSGSVKDSSEDSNSRLLVALETISGRLEQQNSAILDEAEILNGSTKVSNEIKEELQQNNQILNKLIDISGSTIDASQKESATLLDALKEIQYGINNQSVVLSDSHQNSIDDSKQSAARVIEALESIASNIYQEQELIGRLLTFNQDELVKNQSSFDGIKEAVESVYGALKELENSSNSATSTQLIESKESKNALFSLNETLSVLISSYEQQNSHIEGLASLNKSFLELTKEQIEMLSSIKSENQKSSDSMLSVLNKTEKNIVTNWNETKELKEVITLSQEGLNNNFMLLVGSLDETTKRLSLLLEGQNDTKNITLDELNTAGQNRALLEDINKKTDAQISELRALNENILSLKDGILKANNQSQKSKDGRKESGNSKSKDSFFKRLFG